MFRVSPVVIAASIYVDERRSADVRDLDGPAWYGHLTPALEDRPGLSDHACTAGQSQQVDDARGGALSG